MNVHKQLIKPFYVILVSVILFSCQQKTAINNLTAHAFRLKPGQDLKTEIQNLANNKQIKAGWGSTCVGSLTDYKIRFANQA